MKTRKFMVLFIALMCSATLSMAQPGFGGSGSAKFINGDVKFLKGQTSLNVKFDYDNMLVGNLSEEAYITQETQKQNKMKSGSGDSWATKWKADKASRFEPQFMEWFNKSIKKLGIVATSVTGDATTKYSMIVKVIKTEPGVYIGVSAFGHDAGQETYITIMVSFVETTTPATDLATISVPKSVGTATSFANYDTGLRITDAYVIAGKTLGSFIAKNCK